MTGVVVAPCILMINFLALFSCRCVATDEFSLNFCDKCTVLSNFEDTRQGFSFGVFVYFELAVKCSLCLVAQIQTVWFL